jgi:hypothetical protein
MRFALRPAARSGRWFELAKALDALHASGTPNTEVFEVTGLTPLEQNAWKVQAAVYVSLEAAEDFPRPLLTHYYDENNAASLAELRVRPSRSCYATASLQILTRTPAARRTRRRSGAWPLRATLPSASLT